MSDNLTGSCLCRSVKYIIKTDIKAVANCHCDTCKKSTGAAFSTIAVIDENSLNVIEGKKNLTSYQVSENAEKYFCRNCGTPVYSLHKKYPGNYMLQVGTLDEASLATPAINIFCQSMLSWTNNISDLTCFEKEPTQ